MRRERGRRKKRGINEGRSANKIADVNTKDTSLKVDPDIALIYVSWGKEEGRARWEVIDSREETNDRRKPMVRERTDLRVGRIEKTKFISRNKFRFS